MRDQTTTLYIRAQAGHDSGMEANWTKLEDGSWGARLTGSDYHAKSWIGLPCTLTSRSGSKKEVILSEHVKTFRIKGGTVVDIFRVAS